MTPEILAYTAGAIDSDGCIQLMKRKKESDGIYVLRICLSHVGEQVPLWLSRNHGGKVFTIKMSKMNRSMFRWTLEGNKAADLLEKIIPYLVLKAERAKVGIQYQKTAIFRHSFTRLPQEVIDERNVMFFQMRNLNKASSRFDYKESEM
jgi:hypothetical protein